MRMINFEQFDEAAFGEVAAVLLAANRDERVKEVAERSPGLYVREVEDEPGVALLFLMDGDEVVEVGTFELATVQRTPPVSAN